MKKANLVFMLLLCGALALTGCAGEGGGDAPALPFEEGQYYAAAYLGYQEMGSLEPYARYLEGEEPPVHYISPGDFYLVVPRYSGMALAIYKTDIETMEPALVYEDPDCRPFIIQCNVSDIFSDTVIRLTYQGETAEFIPFISLENGRPDIGEKGLDITIG